MRHTWLFVLLCLSVAATAQTSGKEITLEDVFKKGTFSVKSVPGFNAMADGKRYTQMSNQGGRQEIEVYELASGKKLNTLFDNSLHRPGGKTISVSDYTFSDNEQKMLLFADGEHIYRHSAVYNVYVFDLKDNTVKQVGDQKIMHATFSPDGSKVAYVKDNNLYYYDLASANTVTVTNDGKWNHIINGNCDWVYEEEFGFTKAFQWSADGSYIAYYRFDESKVKEYTMVKFDSLYPTQYTYKYPKAGEDNSVVQIKLYSLAGKTTTTADVGANTDIYIPRIKWTNEASSLCVYRLNRLQNKLELLLTDAGNGRSQVIYEEENPYYVDINDNLQFLPDNASFIFDSERSGYTHLYKWDWKKKQLTALTDGKYDVASLVGIDKASKLVYYTAAVASPMDRQLYVVDWQGKKRRQLTKEPGMHAIVPCEGYQYFLDKYSALNTPPVASLLDANGKVVRVLEENQKLKERMAEYKLGKLSFTTVKGAMGDDLNAWMITPPDFDPGKKYPVLMFQYSGPGSQQVTDKFPVSYYFWHQMLAQKGYIIVCTDGTGTGMRGQEFKKKTYLQLGKLESDDQIAAARYLGSLPYVDKDRIGIWGWSYGGFMSSTCILKGNDVFKAAIAVAPVTNWRYYDNIYTERYMRTPAENPNGYDENAPEKMASKLKGKFLLIHGSGDDNVHFQNAMMLAEALIQNNKEFDSEYYPNKAHGISGGNSTFHLFSRMTKFILANL
ncbi:MAG: S9 family peptidase [Flavipsychrobacter sp.]|nr:S9 family peptidase [Flavipsychrobacter sp.]